MPTARYAHRGDHLPKLPPETNSLLLKNKKAAKPRPGRLIKRRNRCLSTCHHHRHVAWELLSSSPGSRKPELRSSAASWQPRLHSATPFELLSPGRSRRWPPGLQIL